MSNKRLSQSTVTQGASYPQISAGSTRWATGTGGTEVTSGGYKYHTFTTNGTFEFTSAGKVEYLIVGGGGGAGSTTDCGGGAGGVLTGELSRDVAGSATVVVGAGGSGGFNSNGAGNEQGHTGFFSRFDTAYVYGGGGGGGTVAGGSGSGANGVAVPSQGGNNGGTTGGGGAGAAGSGANGGIGTAAFSDWGIATSTGELSSSLRYYAGGGAGIGGTRGIGGGGAPGSTGTAGTANTGGGGGADNASGGSGVVIIRYGI
jgi:hypothetical protein